MQWKVSEGSLWNIDANKMKIKTHFLRSICLHNQSVFYNDIMLGQVSVVGL